MSFLDHAKHALDKGEPVKGDNSVGLDSSDKSITVAISKEPLLGSVGKVEAQIVNMRVADIMEEIESERALYQNKIRPEFEAEKRKHAEGEISPNTNDAFRGMGDPSADVGTPTDPISENQMNI